MSKPLDPDQLARSGSEDSEQMALFCWIQQQVADGLYPELEWAFAVPNGGARDIRVAAKLKATGVKSGVSDVVIPVPRHGMHGLFMELKKSPEFGGKVSQASDKQLEFGAAMQAMGYGFVVCCGWKEGRDVLIQYMN